MLTVVKQVAVGMVVDRATMGGDGGHVRGVQAASIMGRAASMSGGVNNRGAAITSITEGEVLEMAGQKTQREQIQHRC